MMDLEICVDSIESAIAAEVGGAQRVELCSALSEGGITPSAALIRAVRSRVKIGVYVMIRPRSGDFLYSQDEFALMQADIEFAAECGVDGVVFGLLSADGNVDVKRTRSLVELAHRKPAECETRLEVTFHRALDMTPDIVRSIEDVIATGADRVLTSGAEVSAEQGIQSIRKLITTAGDRVKVMAGGGIRAHNVQQIALLTGAREFHAALKREAASPMIFRKASMHLGDPASDEYIRSIVLAEDVRHLREAIQGVTKERVQKSGLTPASV